MTWATVLTSAPQPLRLALLLEGANAFVGIFRAQRGCTGNFAEVATVVAPPATYLDSAVEGGIPYGYMVRKVGASCESDDSACSAATTTGPCRLEPTFAGLVAADATGLSVCGVSLSWTAGAASCAGPLRYNVYRSATTPKVVIESSGSVCSSCAHASSALFLSDPSGVQLLPTT